MELIEKTIQNLRTVWDLPFAKEVLLVVVTAAITHFRDMYKFKKQRHSKYKDTIGENIATALTAVREIGLSTNAINIYDKSVEHTDADSVNAVHEVVYYPGFMSDKELLVEFCESVSAARGKHEPYLDLMSAAYLYALERYLLNVAMYVRKYDLLEELDTLGLILIIDISKWEKAFDRHLVKRINQPHYRLFTRDGWLWKLAKQYVEWRYLKKSELNKMMKMGPEIFNKSESEESHARTN